MRLERFLPYRLSVLTNRVSSAIAATVAALNGQQAIEGICVTHDQPVVVASQIHMHATTERVIVEHYGIFVLLHLNM